MNERIKELISQAQKEVWGNSPYNGSPEFEGYELDPKNFAELIIQECLGACSRANEIRHFVPPGQQQVVLDCMREIETTFWS